jgi:hypothetical protein
MRPGPRSLGRERPHFYINLGYDESGPTSANLARHNTDMNIGWGHRISLTIGFKWRSGGPPKSLRAAALISHHSFKATQRNFSA